MYGRTSGGPEYLLLSIPFWIAAVILGAFVLFGRGGGDGEPGPRLVFATAEVTAVATQTPFPTATVQPPTPMPTPTMPPEPVTHTVQSGESLTSICAAERPGLADCVEQVVALNGLAGADFIEVGQELELPPVDTPVAGGGAAPTPAP